MSEVAKLIADDHDALLYSFPDSQNVITQSTANPQI